MNHPGLVNADLEPECTATNDSYNSIISSIGELESVLGSANLGSAVSQDGEEIGDDGDGRKERLARVDVWRREILQIRGRAIAPTLIAITGATGAGKSTLLNALLEQMIVPTSGIRACTSVPTKISYHREPSITAEVVFLTREEWANDVRMGLGDFTDDHEEDEECQEAAQQGHRSRNYPHSKKKHGSGMEKYSLAWDKIHAVYPNMTPAEFRKVKTAEEILLNPLFAEITEQLGKIKTITCTTSEEFAEAIKPYIDAKPSLVDYMQAETTSAFWPLVREVHIQCNAECLRTGATLVDLPGVGDSNVARSTIATKCDDMSASEIINNLNLRTHELSQLSFDIQIKEKDCTHLRNVLRLLQEIKSAKIEELTQLQMQLATLEVKSIPTVNLKRKLDPYGNEDSLRPTKKMKFINHTEVQVADQAQLQHNINKLRDTIDDHDQYVKKIEQESLDLKRSKFDLVAHARAEACKKRIKKDVCIALGEIGIEDEHDVASQDADAQYINDPMDVSELDFPVFTCSSREYIRMKRLIVDEEQDVPHFTNTDRTEIPLLQRWIHQITTSSRKKELGLIRNLLNILAQEVKTFCKDNAGGLNESERTMIKEKWSAKETGIGMRLQKILSTLVEDTISQYNNLFKDQLEKAIHQAVNGVSLKLLNFYDSKITFMHGNTFRAVLTAVIRHHGLFDTTLGSDFNEVLIADMKKVIARQWAEFFECDHFLSLESAVLNTMTTFWDGLSGEETLLPIQAFFERHKDDMIKQANIFVKHTTHDVQRLVNEKQKNLSRAVVHQMKKLLMNTYDEAAKISGKGCAQKQKSIMHQFIEEESETVFKELAEFLINGFENISRSVGDHIKADCSHLAQKVEFTVAELWKPDHKALPLQVRAGLSDVERVADGITQMLARQMTE
ncbi:hypothetical protein C8J55DRAFT_605104 [Lentinula edodes]|uniref:Uncharacterized protein n=1 Tax=Lentinula lateritia TaxID=40482 RepID=A0A9W9AJK0_9AGAR|nr:hypothetical protein C8J55DRAFT_605104 [Lentinula edodes]